MLNTVAYGGDVIKVSASSLAKLDVENLRFIQLLDKNGSMESVV